MTKDKTTKREPVTKEDFENYLATALQQDAGKRQEISRAITNLANGTSSNEAALGTQVLIAVLITVILHDSGRRENTKKIKTAFWLTDDTINALFRRNGEVPPGENPTPLLPGFELTTDDIGGNVAKEDIFIPGRHSDKPLLPTAKIHRDGWKLKLAKGELTHETEINTPNGQISFTFTTAQAPLKDSRYNMEYSRLETAVGNLKEDGYNFQTEAQIYRQFNAISGKHADSTISKEALRWIHEAMVFLTTTKAELAGSGVNAAYSAGGGRNGCIIAADWTWKWRRDGKRLVKQEGWEVFRLPLGYHYSKLIHQITKVPFSLWGSSGIHNNTLSCGNIRYYLLQERERIRSSEMNLAKRNERKPLKLQKPLPIRSRKCLFSTIFEAAGIQGALVTETKSNGKTAFTKSARVLRRRRIDEVAQILDDFIKQGHIKSWHYVNEENKCEKKDADGVALYVL